MGLVLYVYTCLNTANNNTEICQPNLRTDTIGATSTSTRLFVVASWRLTRQAGTRATESAAAIRYNGMFHQFFAGIPTPNGMQGKIGRAVSSQPFSGYAKDANPVLAPTPGRYDSDSLSVLNLSKRTIPPS